MIRILTPRDKEFIENLPPNYCARFARLTSEKIFGSNFNLGHAWLIGEVNKIQIQIEEFADLRDYNLGLYPGAIITWFDPKSNFNEPERILAGTHAMAYIGKRRGIPYFLEQRGSTQQEISLDIILKQELQPRQIVIPE